MDPDWHASRTCGGDPDIAHDISVIVLGLPLMGMSDYLMDLQERGFGDTGGRTVCLECIHDEGLRRSVSESMTEPACTFCGRDSGDEDDPIAADFEVLMTAVIGAIRFLYDRSEETLYWSDDVTPRYDSWVVADAVCAGAVADNVLEAIEDVLDPDEWNEDPGALRPDVALARAWDDFAEKVKYKTRFVFLSIPEEHSTQPDEFTTSEILDALVKIIQARGALRDLPGGTNFWRGRMVDKPEPLELSASTLGSPPPMRASANRMSPAGISMFYGCSDVATVVAEIGAHSPQRYAAVGQFESVRQLTMVDLATLPPVPSLFDPEQRNGYHELRFLHDFARDLSAPIMLDGREHIEYVPTQVVTEYLRWLPSFHVDGLLYTSAQNGGTSCVIFCGPEGCADKDVTEQAVLRLVSGSIHAVRVVSSPVE